MGKPVPGLAIIMGQHPHGGEEPDDDEGPPSSKDMSHEEHQQSMDDAADEMFDALKSGNKDHFRMALDAYCDLHMKKPADDEPSKEDLDEDEGDGDEGDDGSYFR